MQVPKRRSEQSRKFRGPESDHLTAEAVERLRRTLASLETTERPRALEDLTRAREMGDLSENAAYSEAKGRLGRIDGRIFSLRERIKRAIIIESGPDASGAARIGATVTVELTDGKRKTYRIVGPQETNPSQGRISHLSPLGRALIGRRAGDTTEVDTGERTVRYAIIAVE